MERRHQKNQSKKIEKMNLSGYRLVSANPICSQQANSLRGVSSARSLFIGIIFLLILIPSFLWAGDWRKQDTYRELTYITLHIVDWNQTLQIAENSDRYYEMNPILGRHPSEGKVNFYMGSSLIGHAFVSYMLPPKYRAWWQYITIGIQVGVVAYNYNIGIRTTF